MDIFSQEIENYITSHIEPEPDFLKKLVRDTNLYTLKPRMLSGHLQGRLLKMFCAMTGAKRVVEIGTFTGYSALCMAEALPADGEVHTIDINDELEELILNGFDRAGEVGKKIHFHIGDAAELIPQMQPAIAKRAKRHLEQRPSRKAPQTMGSRLAPQRLLSGIDRPRPKRRFSAAMSGRKVSARRARLIRP